jgi:plasmid stabilization system protein ParE
MVIWPEPAESDLRAIHEFIAHDSRHCANKVTQAAVDRIRPESMP